MRRAATRDLPGRVRVEMGGRARGCVPRCYLVGVALGFRPAHAFAVWRNVAVRSCTAKVFAVRSCTVKDFAVLSAFAVHTYKAVISLPCALARQRCKNMFNIIFK